MPRRELLPHTLASLAGCGFALFLLIAFASVDPLRNATDAELLAWWQDSANQQASMISMYFMLAAVPCFLLFLVSLRHRLSSAEASDAPVSNWVFACGVAMAAVLGTNAVTRGAIATSVQLGDEVLPGVDALRATQVISLALIGVVYIGLAAMVMLGVGVITLRTKVLPTWVGISAIVLCAICLAAIPAQMGAFASPLFQLWVVATSVALWRARKSPAAITSPSTTNLSPAH